MDYGNSGVYKQNTLNKWNLEYQGIPRKPLGNSEHSLGSLCAATFGKCRVNNWLVSANNSLPVLRACQCQPLLALGPVIISHAPGILANLLLFLILAEILIWNRHSITQISSKHLIQTIYLSRSKRCHLDTWYLNNNSIMEKKKKTSLDMWYLDNNSIMEKKRKLLWTCDTSIIIQLWKKKKISLDTWYLINNSILEREKKIYENILIVLYCFVINI